MGKLSSIAVLTAISLWPTSVMADFECSAELSYSWKRSEGKGDAASQKVLWGKISRRAETEDAAKKMIEEVSATKQSDMRAECERMHQNLADCVATKLSAKEGLFPFLSFTARKSLEESIASDCSRMQGTCLPPEPVESQCVEHKEASEEEEGAAEAEVKKGSKK